MGVLQILGAGFLVVVAAYVAVWFGGVRGTDRDEDKDKDRFNGPE